MIGNETGNHPEEYDSVTGFKNIFELTTVETEILAKRVEKNKGVVRIFVHPLYEKHVGSDSRGNDFINWEDEQKLANIEKGFLKTLATQKNNTTPILIMEEWNSVESTKDYLAKQNVYQNPFLYYVPTHTGSPEPKTSLYSREQQRQNWQMLKDFLTTIKTTKLIVGGMYLRVHTGLEPGKVMHNFMSQRKDKGAKYLQYGLEKCVRGVLRNLSSDFDIEISGMTFPVSRTQLKEIEEHDSKY